MRTYNIDIGAALSVSSSTIATSRGGLTKSEQCRAYRHGTDTLRDESLKDRQDIRNNVSFVDAVTM
jgi:hypothetical protein